MLTTHRPTNNFQVPPIMNMDDPNNRSVVSRRLRKRTGLKRDAADEVLKIAIKQLSTPSNTVPLLSPDGSLPEDASKTLTGIMGGEGKIYTGLSPQDTENFNEAAFAGFVCDKASKSNTAVIATGLAVAPVVPYFGLPLAASSSVMSGITQAEGLRCQAKAKEIAEGVWKKLVEQRHTLGEDTSEQKPVT